MREEMRVIDDYSHYEFDPEEDLNRVPYWVFVASHTAPGEPRCPMENQIFMNHGCAHGFRSACEKLSVPTTNGNDMRLYRGYELLRAVLTTEEERKKREPRFREGLRQLLENFDELYQEGNEEMMSRCKRIQQFDFEHASMYQLMEILDESIATKHRMLEVHHYFMVGVGSIYLLFEELCTELLGIDDTDPQFQKLLTGFDNRTFQTDRSLFQLSRRANELGLEKLFLTAKAEEVIPRLEQSEEGRQWIKELRDFLQTDGWRMPLMLEIRTPTWLEDPTPAIVHVQQFMAKGPTFDLDEIMRVKAKEREEAEKDILSQVPQEQKEWFAALMRVAQRYGWWNEDHTFYLEQMVNSTCRYALLQIGRRLSQAGAIEDAADILFLVPEEVHKLLLDPWTYSGKKTVRQRKEQWEEDKKVTPPPFFLKEGVTVEQAVELMVQSREPAMVAVAIGKAPKPRPELKPDFWGVAGSAGVAEGPARVLFSPEQLGEVQPGEILVAPGTYSAWTPIFSLIGGAVIDRGGTMSHSCIIGREYGIPVVINVFDASSKIKTGQRIRVDGNNGAVFILD